MENLESVIESVVFVAGEPVLISDLCLKFDVKQKQVEKLFEAKSITQEELSARTKIIEDRIQIYNQNTQQDNRYR